MTVITVARQLGSFGDWIAEQLAAKLDYEFIDRRLVEEIASITETSVEEVERYDEKGEGRLRFFLKKLLVPEVAPGTFPLSAAAYAPEFGLEFPHMRDDVGEATYLDRGTYQLLITTLVQDFGESGQGRHRRSGQSGSPRRASPMPSTSKSSPRSKRGLSD